VVGVLDEDELEVDEEDVDESSEDEDVSPEEVSLEDVSVDAATLALACAPRTGSSPAPTRTQRRARTARKIAVLVRTTLSHDGRRRTVGRGVGFMAMTIGAMPQPTLIAP
jgi:hypothetical protein